MTSLQNLTGGSCNAGNDNNSNLLLLQASPVVTNHGQVITSNNTSIHDNSHSDTLAPTHLTSHEQNNMSSHMNGYQVNLFLEFYDFVQIKL